MASQGVVWAVFCVLCLRAVFSEDVKEYRNISTEYLTHPNVLMACNDGSCNNLVHTSAVGHRDTVHYVYSTLGPLAILVAKTPNNVKLTVDWEKFISKNSTVQDHSLQFEGEVSSSALLSFDTIYVYNDTDDKASMQEGSDMTAISTDSLLWSLASPVEGRENFVRFTSYEVIENKTQTVTFEFQASSGLAESTSELPHLLLNSNLTQIDVYLENVHHNNFTQPRIALGMTVVASKFNFVPSIIAQEKSLNDELSPGAFRTMNWLNSENSSASLPSNDQVGTFVQWKPISYLSTIKSLQNLTMVSTYGLHHFNSSSNMPCSLATGYFGHKGLEQNTWMSSVNVSFGITGDRFYSKTNFTTWQLTFGMGSHPQGSISLLIILLIAIGLGIPILLMIVGAIYLPIRRHVVKRRGYEELSSSYPRIA